MRRDAVNGRAALEFDGITSLMKTYGSTFTLSQPDTFFIVYKSLDAQQPARAFVFDSRDSSARQVFGQVRAGPDAPLRQQRPRLLRTTYPFAGYRDLERDVRRRRAPISTATA